MGDFREMRLVPKGFAPTSQTFRPKLPSEGLLHFTGMMNTSSRLPRNNSLLMVPAKPFHEIKNPQEHLWRRLVSFSLNNTNSSLPTLDDPVFALGKNNRSFFFPDSVIAVVNHADVNLFRCGSHAPCHLKAWNSFKKSAGKLFKDSPLGIVSRGPPLGQQVLAKEANPNPIASGPSFAKSSSTAEVMILAASKSC